MNNRTKMAVAILLGVSAAGCAGVRHREPIETDAGTPIPDARVPVDDAARAPDASAPVVGTLEIVSGDHQLLLPTAPAGQPVVLRALDGRGRPFHGAHIALALVDGDATLGSTAVITDPSGRAEVMFSGAGVPADVSWVVSHVRATRVDGEGEVTFMATTAAIDPARMFSPVAVLEEPASRDCGSTVAGGVIAGAIQLTLVVRYGPWANTPIPDVALRVMPDLGEALSVSCARGEVLTDGGGRARCDLSVEGEPGRHRFIAVLGERIEFGGMLVGIDAVSP